MTKAIPARKWMLIWDTTTIWNMKYICVTDRNSNLILIPKHKLTNAY